MNAKQLGTVVAALLVLTPSLAATQEDHSHGQPYAGLQSRELKALSAEEIEALEEGQGMGFALAAELNGYPGPRHVLELREELDLSPEQETATRRIFEQMQADARRKGAELIELEAQLDLAFRSRTINAESLTDLMSRIGQARASLRGTHLEAHLELTEHLTSHQVHLYQQLRGYGHGQHGGGGP